MSLTYYVQARKALVNKPKSGDYLTVNETLPYVALSPSHFALDWSEFVPVGQLLVDAVCNTRQPCMSTETMKAEAVAAVDAYNRSKQGLQDNYYSQKWV